MAVGAAKAALEGLENGLKAKGKGLTPAAQQTVNDAKDTADKGQTSSQNSLNAQIK